jgi:hypothetical protein
MVKRNKDIMTEILETVIRKIIRQGGGCNIEGLGAGYHIKKTDIRDPIGLLLGYVPQFHFGVISDDMQKPLVNRLLTQFGFDDTQYSERHKFVDFLQRIQDEHDLAWCEFSGVKTADPMTHFLVGCDEIKKDFRL